jgi:hypothetical protein
VLETGIVVPLGVSFRTLLSHQLDVTAAWLVRAHPATIVRADYQLSAELGEVLIGLRAGLAESFPAAELGWFAGATIGLAMSAAGGGAF